MEFDCEWPLDNSQKHEDARVWRAKGKFENIFVLSIEALLMLHFVKIHANEINGESVWDHKKKNVLNEKLGDFCVSW